MTSLIFRHAADSMSCQILLRGLSSFDLYKVLRPLKGFLKLPGLKQEQMEAFLGEQKRVYCNGGECIKIYKKYMAHQRADRPGYRLWDTIWKTFSDLEMCLR